PAWSAWTASRTRGPGSCATQGPPRPDRRRPGGHRRHRRNLERLLESPGRVRLDLDEPVDAVAPGQAGVLYDGDLVLGGGTVSTTGPMS
ncbi:MAG TPA: aminomethyltransferase beta-barrel domain-containing protein, partial [Actinomycetota bacterium]|nr:aminomethyltransferase beta-barrel domain-containing protein [Actinomycetota bacterium]